MISGVKIPVICPFKFYPASADFDNGINFINTDNQESTSQDWAGVYSKFFAQIVPLYWHDLSYAIDFQIYATAAVYASITCELIDSDGDTVETLTKSSFFTYSSPADYQLRFYLATMSGIDTSAYYRLQISNGSGALYVSERIQFAEKADYNFPLEYSNFENDFACIFDNGASGTWSGKLMVPMRMFEPDSSDERETYTDDSGGMVTLRSNPMRKYNFETLPIPLWFGEKLRLIFSCSDIELNKLSINTEEVPAIDRVNETNLCVVSGKVTLNDYAGEYWQDEQINTITELLTGWTDTDSDVVLFNTTGKEITAMISDDDASQEVESNSISVTEDESYVVVIDLRDYNNGRVLASDPNILASYDFIPASAVQLETAEMTMTLDGDSYDIKRGVNVIHYVAGSTGSEQIVLQLDDTTGAITFAEIIPSMKKIT